jgi:hypothetical protein
MPDRGEDTPRMRFAIVGLLLSTRPDPSEAVVALLNFAVVPERMKPRLKKASEEKVRSPIPASCSLSTRLLILFENRCRQRNGEPTSYP